jgi:hypothetical protein
MPLRSLKGIIIISRLAVTMQQQATGEAKRAFGLL